MDVNVTINCVNFYISTIILSPKSQKTINKAVTKCYTLPFESWTTDRRPVNTGAKIQLDVGSSSTINAPLYLIATHQKIQHTDPADPDRNLSKNRFNNATFDIVTP